MCVVVGRSADATGAGKNWPLVRRSVVHFILLFGWRAPTAAFVKSKSVDSTAGTVAPLALYLARTDGRTDEAMHHGQPVVAPHCTA